MRKNISKSPGPSSEFFIFVIVPICHPEPGTNPERPPKQTLGLSPCDLRLLVIRLLLLVDGGLGDTVQVTLAALGDAAATLVLVNLEDTDLLKGLEDLAVNGA